MCLPFLLVFLLSCLLFEIFFPPRLHVDLPGPGIEPMSFALAGEFFTTEPPGEPRLGFFLILFTSLKIIHLISVLTPTFSLLSRYLFTFKKT